jgi:predicted Zn-dependent peptidase
MAFKALLSEEYINRERAPILSEKQMRNTISYRRQCKMMELMHRFPRVL